jgi:undecaprenyl-diphosphatase
MSSSIFLTAVILGIVEGLTEFLPVSSTGHLILADSLLGFESSSSKVFDVVIQLGAILAVVWTYRERLWHEATGLGSDPRSRRFAANVLLAFLPAAVVGALAHGFIKSVLFSPWVVAVALIVGGIAILLIERLLTRPRVHDTDDMPAGTALGIGFCQLLAMIPGVSRSGATIMGALALGVDRKAAAEFSFFLAIPTMFGATVYDVFKNRHDLNGGDAATIAVGFVVSFIVALAVVRWFVGFVGRHGFGPFAWYRIAVGGIALALLYLHR